MLRDVGDAIPYNLNNIASRVGSIHESTEKIAQKNRALREAPLPKNPPKTSEDFCLSYKPYGFFQVSNRDYLDPFRDAAKGFYRAFRANDGGKTECRRLLYP